MEEQSSHGAQMGPDPSGKSTNYTRTAHQRGWGRVCGHMAAWKPLWSMRIAAFSLALAPAGLVPAQNAHGGSGPGRWKPAPIMPRGPQRHPLGWYECASGPGGGPRAQGGSGSHCHGHTSWLGVATGEPLLTNPPQTKMFLRPQSSNFAPLGSMCPKELGGNQILHKCVFHGP